MFDVIVSEELGSLVGLGNGHHRRLLRRTTKTTMRTRLGAFRCDTNSRSKNLWALRPIFAGIAIAVASTFAFFFDTDITATRHVFPFMVNTHKRTSSSKEKIYEFYSEGSSTAFMSF
jgi:hypothetical protein